MTTAWCSRSASRSSSNAVAWLARSRTGPIGAGASILTSRVELSGAVADWRLGTSSWCAAAIGHRLAMESPWPSARRTL